MKKISNETKIGILAAAGIAVLILGFNYLKGKDLFDKRTIIYAEFPSIEGLSLSNPVTINGLQVGAVSGLKEKDKNLTGIIVEIALSKDLNIPDNSTATINPSLGGLGTTTISIHLGNSSSYLQNGSSIGISNKPGVIEEVRKRLAPTLERVNHVMDSLKLTLSNINNTIDPATQANLRQTIANLAGSTASLQTLLNTQQGALAKSLNNVEHFTGALAKNEGKINSVMENVEKTTAQLSNAKIEETIASLQGSVNSLNNAMDKLNSTDGSAGLLLNDKKLYQNLENSTRSLNILLDDLRLHPKRYVSISIFGKKAKGEPLMAPLPAPADSARLVIDSVRGN